MLNWGVKLLAIFQFVVFVLEDIFIEKDTTESQFVSVFPCKIKACPVT